MERNQGQDVVSSVAEAVRQRIRSLEEELAHWRLVLSQCEQQTPAAQHADLDAPDTQVHTPHHDAGFAHAT